MACAAPVAGDDRHVLVGGAAPKGEAAMDPGALCSVGALADSRLDHGRDSLAGGVCGVASAAGHPRLTLDCAGESRLPHHLVGRQRMILSVPDRSLADIVIEVAEAAGIGADVVTAGGGSVELDFDIARRDELIDLVINYVRQLMETGWSESEV